MLISLLQQRLDTLSVENRRRHLRVSMGPCTPQVHVSPRDPSGPADPSGTPLLAFCSNDYLGLANHPELIEAWAQGARRYGVGSGASHLISGHSAAHAALEAELARWQAPYIPQARALLFSTGYMANMALLGALGLADATLFCDKLNHASLIDGASLAAAKVQRYPHAHLERLAFLLQQCDSPLKFIVTDAVFSMDGSVAPGPELLRLAHAHDAWLIVDDAHGFGVLGPQGQGSLAHWGVGSERLIYMGTLGKAAGVAGAFVVAHEVVIDWLINTARPYIYTTASAPAQAHALLHSLRLIQGEQGHERRQHLQSLIRRLRNAGAELAPGWRWAASDTPIQPLMIGPNLEALSVSRQLEQAGLWVPAIRPPTVPVGTARLRVTLSASHTAADVDRLLSTLGAIASASAYAES